MDDTFVLTTETGFDFYTNNETRISQDYAARHWGMKQPLVFLAKGKNNDASYVLVLNNAVVMESNTGWENFCYKLDIWALANRYEQQTGWSTVNL